jgi:hypothetical protein
MHERSEERGACFSVQCVQCRQPSPPLKPECMRGVRREVEGRQAPAPPAPVHTHTQHAGTARPECAGLGREGRQRGAALHCTAQEGMACMQLAASSSSSSARETGRDIICMQGENKRIIRLPSLPAQLQGTPLHGCMILYACLASACPCVHRPRLVNAFGAAK